MDNKKFFLNKKILGGLGQPHEENIQNLKEAQGLTPQTVFF